MSSDGLIPIVNRTNETNIIPPQNLRPHIPVVRNHQSFVGSIITNNCNSMTLVFTSFPDVHNDWIAFINLAANSLIAKPYTLEIPYTCFCGGDKAILADDLIKNSPNKPWVCASLARIAIFASNLLDCGINLWYRLSVCEVEVNHRSKRSQSAIVIFTIMILVKTTEILKLNSRQAIILLYDLLLWLKMSVLPRYSSSQATCVTVTLHPQYKRGARIELAKFSARLPAHKL